MKKYRVLATSFLRTTIGCALFALGFSFFLAPSGLNAGGVSGLAMILQYVLKTGTIGGFTALMNLPLFALAGWKIGRRYFLSSLTGMLISSYLIDILSDCPAPSTEPLIGALYGGALCGLGLGIVLSNGGSTGGSDIIVRLMKLKWPNVPIGTINTCFDLTVAVLTGIVFQSMGQALYSGVAIFIAGRVVDAVVYRFDYSRVAFIISKDYLAIAEKITADLHRGVTFLHGEGFYSHNETNVIITAIKRQQLAELKELVVSADPDAFIIVQEAHQVLGDGFSRYAKDAL